VQTQMHKIIAGIHYDEQFIRLKLRSKALDQFRPTDTARERKKHVNLPKYAQRRPEADGGTVCRRWRENPM